MLSSRTRAALALSPGSLLAEALPGAFEAQAAALG